jgi:hypothetical protein
MDRQSRLIFRYENARHHPEISTFPHHKHMFNRIEESEEPDIACILSEIERIVLNFDG